MKERLHCFDVLKGIAIFMVVIGHVLTMCVRQIDSALLFKFVGAVHMPLFFFISGWFTFSVKPGVSPVPRLLPRAKRLLVPMIAVSTLWIFRFPYTGIESPLDSTFQGLWFNEWKNGYWFTLVLFELIVLYALLCRAFVSIRNIGMQIVFVLAAWIFLEELLKLVPGQVYTFLSFELMSMFFPVFMLGAVASRNRALFFDACNRSTVVTEALLALAVSFAFVGWPWKYSDTIVMIARVVLHVAVAIIAIAAVRPWVDRSFASETTGRFARLWAYVGKRSLAVYLLHYFFLFPLGCVREALRAMDLALLPTLFFAGAVAACVIACVLFVDYLLSFSRPLSFLLTGGGLDPAPLEPRKA